MWFRRKPEPRHDDPEHDQGPGVLARGFRWFVLATVFLALGSLAIWVAVGTPDQSRPTVSGALVPERRSPPDQSNLVPHQDQAIYEAVEPGAETGLPKELLPSPERPLDRDAVVAQIAEQDRSLAASQATQNARTDRAASATEEAGTTSGRAEQPPASTTESQAPAPSAPPPSAMTIVPESEPSSAAEATQPAAPQDTASDAAMADAYRIQIASVRSRDQAQDEWDRIAGRHSTLLAGLKPYFPTFASSDGSQWVRVQGGPLEEEALADLLCAQLSARKVDCLVISP